MVACFAAAMLKLPYTVPTRSNAGQSAVMAAIVSFVDCSVVSP